MVNVVIESMPLTNTKVEMVELKGIGHPDTLADALSEAVSVKLSRYYLKHFGEVLHHNVDKSLIVAGKSKPAFGGGSIIEPMKIIICGRVTAKVGNVHVPVNELVKGAVDEYMGRFPLAEYIIVPELKEGASNLKEVFKRKVPVANDTSFGVSYYPYSRTEELVLKVRDIFGSESFKEKYPSAGSDIKIMAVRQGEDITLTLAVAFIGRHLKTMDEYLDAKEGIADYIKKMTGADVLVNTLDSFESVSSVYLTVSGLSAEMGDDGQVGRGNRYNGLISPAKPTGIEAVAGKNIFHPGKLYQILAFRISEALVNDVGLKEVHVSLVTQIGKPLDDPFVVSVKAAGSIDLKQIKDTVDYYFSDLAQFQKDLLSSD